MTEYIIRETTYPLATKQEVVGELVRCKDCIHYEIAQLKSDYTEDRRYKPSVCTRGWYARYRKPDWYCADGERREWWLKFLQQTKMEKSSSQKKNWKAF